MTNPVEIVISGLGIATAIGQGRQAFTQALLEGQSSFGVMTREGRQRPDTAFLGAELPDLTLPENFPKSLVRTSSLTAQAAATVIAEAWQEARLGSVPGDRLGLVIGGSNVQQRYLHNMQRKYEDRPRFLSPLYALSFMDTDLCGLCTELFGIQGEAMTVGGASASGQLAVISACNMVASGRVSAAIAVGALMDMSHWECAGFRSIGAMGSERFADQPQLACRPFDQDRDGFIFGEASAAVVVETLESAMQRGAPILAKVSGWAYAVDGHRNPDPSPAGQLSVIQRSLAQAGWKSRDVDYINPHGSGSGLGDRIELETLTQAGLRGAHINTTKSLTGHGLTAAGAVEIVATVIQMQEGRLHACRNLENPLDDGFQWVLQGQGHRSVERAISLSYGFGGINSAVCLERA